MLSTFTTNPETASSAAVADVMCAPWGTWYTTESRIEWQCRGNNAELEVAVCVVAV